MPNDQHASEPLFTGASLRTARVRADMSQDELAAAAGVTRRTIYNWEREVIEIPRRSQHRLARALVPRADDQPVPTSIQMALEGATDAELLAELTRRMSRRG